MMRAVVLASVKTDVVVDVRAKSPAATTAEIITPVLRTTTRMKTTPPD
jgi:hypothetical protein